MGLFNLFKKKDKKIEGIIEFLGLESWWLDELDDKGRTLIQNNYVSLNGGSIIEGKITGTSQATVSMLTGLSGSFVKPDARYLAYKILNKAESLINKDTNPLDVHFLYNAKIIISYKDRDTITNGLEIAIKACEQQIAYSKIAAREFKKKYQRSPLPEHTGYKQLAIVLEKQKKYKEAIELCNSAMKQGWAGDWKKRIERCKKKKK